MNHTTTQDPYLSLRNRSFRKFIYARFLLTFSIQIQAVVVGWQVYVLTGDPFSLGLIGLSEAIPAITISLFGGHIADKYNQKYIILLCTALLFMCSMALMLLSYPPTQATLWGIYGIIFISGLARGILGPAIFSFWPQLLPNKEWYANAVTWNSTVWQIASTAGPAVGGLLIAPLGITYCYLADALLMLLCFLLFYLISFKKTLNHHVSSNVWTNISIGLQFVFNNQIILSAITLDLFAVLFGGAAAMLPVYANEILLVGPFEFGLLKAAMGVGSIATALTLAYIPLKKNAGKKLLWAVAGFGMCIILFGISEWFWVSFFLLIIAGMLDGVSVIVRGTLMQTYTPDHMKGRVSAVNNIFIGSSNEIGAFESGLAAKLMGVIPSVVFGGCMSIIASVAVAYASPKLRKLQM